MKVFAPVEGFTGVVAGVAFAAGAAQVDRLDPAQRRYLAQHGYGIGQPAQPATGADGMRVTRVDGRTRVRIGTPLADASQEGAQVTVLVDGQIVYEAQHPADEVAAFVEAASQPDVRLSGQVEEDDDRDDDEEPPPEVVTERPAVRASRPTWDAYARHLGIEDPQDLPTKDAVIEACDQAQEHEE